MRRRALLPILLSAAATVVTAAPAAAAGGDVSFSVRPVVYDPALPTTQAYLIHQARPGAVIKSKVRVVNTGTRAGTAYLYPVDATTGRTSGAVYRSRNERRRGVGSWITLGAESLTLAPGNSAVVPLTIRVPDSLRAGDHVGGIVAENAELTTASSPGALKVNIKHLTIVAVVLQVSTHARAGLAIDGVAAGGEHGYQYLYLQLKNVGAVTMKPSGKVLVSDDNGHRIASRTVQLDTFVPQSAINYPVLLPRLALSPGKYRATVELRYGASALGYRRTPGPTSNLTRTFGFEVDRSDYTKVFKGAPPVSGPAPNATNAIPSWILLALAGLIGLVTLLAAAGVVILIRRRARLRPRLSPPAWPGSSS